MDFSRLIFFSLFGFIFLCLIWIARSEACSEVDRSIPGLKKTLDISVRSEASEDPGKTNGTDGVSFILVNGINYVSTNISGYHVVVLDAFTGRHMSTRDFDIVNEASGAADLGYFLDNLPNETITILAVQNSVNSVADTEIQPAVESLGMLGVTSPASIKYRMCHIFIGYKGSRRNDIQTVDVQKARGQGPAINRTVINVTCAYLPEATTTCTHVNVAALKNGGSCTVNSSQSPNCSNALDNSLDTDWFVDQGVGAWIKVTFHAFFTVNKLRIRQRDQNTDQSKDVQLQFSDCSTELIRLTQDKMDFEEFVFTPRRVEWVTFEVKSVYTSSSKNGFKEIQLFYDACNQETICDMLDVSGGETSAPYRLLTNKFSLRVKVPKDALIILSTEATFSAPRYEVEIGANENAATILKRSRIGQAQSLTVLSKQSTPNILDDSSFRAFWFDLDNGGLVLGTGESVIFFWRDSSPLSVKYAFFSSPSSNATFEVCARVDFCYREADHYWPLDKVSPGGALTKRTSSKPGRAQGGWSMGVGEEKNGTKPATLVLDGTSSWVDLGDFRDTCISDPSRCANGISVSFKVNILDTGNRFLLSSGGQSSRGFAVYCVDSTIFIQVRDGEKAWQVQTQYATGTWRTVGFSWSQADGLMALIVGDAYSVTLRDESGKIAKATLDLNTYLVIGRPNDEEAKYGKGAVRDIAVWERKLLDVKLSALHSCNEPALYRSGDPVSGDYLGCFMNDPSSLTFSFNPGGYSSEVLSPGVCRQECGALFYKLAALRHGQQCFCTNSTSSAVQVDVNMCYVPCTGRGDMKCGGKSHFGLYNAIPGSLAGVVMTAPSSTNTFSTFNATLSATFPSLLAVEMYFIFDASGMGVRSRLPVIGYLFVDPGIFDVVGRVELKHQESGQLSNLLTSQNVTASANITGAKLQCPESVPYNFMVECVLEVAQGSGMVATFTYGDDPSDNVIMPDAEVVRKGPDVLDRLEPLQNTTVGTYLLPLTEAQNHGVLEALHVDVLLEGLVQITVFQPTCSSDQRYCVSNHLCVSKNKKCPTARQSCTPGVDTFNLYCGECLEQNNAPCLRNATPPVMNYDFKQKLTHVGFVTSGHKIIALDQRYAVSPGDVVAISFPANGRAVLRTSSIGYAMYYPSSVNISELVRGNRNVSVDGSPQVVNFQPSVGFYYAVRSQLHLSHNFTTASVQDISVTLRNSLGTVHLQARVAVQDIPDGLKLLLPAALRSNRTLNLTCSLLHGTGVTFLWNVGDGRSNISTKQPWVLHQYNSTGTKIVRLTVMNKVGFMAVWCTVVVQEEISGLAFDDDDTLPVPFQSIAEIPWFLRHGSHVFFIVDLGDGNSSVNFTDIKAVGALFVGIYSHNYTSSGVYTVTITASNLVSNATIVRKVSVQLAITDVWVNYTRLAKTNQTINITIVPHVGTDVRYQLHLGDGQIINSTERTVALHFSQAGSYEVVLIAANDISSTEVKCGNIVVQDVISDLSFVTHNLTIALSQEGHFKWKALQGTSVSISVDYGDGFFYKPNFTVSIADVFVAISKHNYSRPGEYRVNVSLINQVSFAFVVESVYVETPVSGLVQAIHRSEKNFSEILKNGMCHGVLYIEANDSVSIAVHTENGTNVQLGYDFGDSHNERAYYKRTFPGIVGTTHRYPDEGEYNITVNASNWNGEVTASCRLIVQYPVTNIVIASNSPQAIPQGQVKFNASFPGTQPSDPLNFTYEFGDGVSVTKDNSVVDHIYNNSGVFPVALKVSNAISMNVAFAEVVVQDTIHGLDCYAVHMDGTLKNKTKNFFPVEFTVRFNCSIHNGTNVSYVRDYGDDGQTSGSEGLSQHKFNNPGTYAVNITAKNLVHSSSKIVSITVQQSVKLSSITNTGITTNNATNFTIYTVNPCTYIDYEIDFGDKTLTKVKYEKSNVSCGKVLHHTAFHEYMDERQYLAKITVRNRVSMDEMSSLVQTSCSPVVSFYNVGQNESTRTSFKKSEGFFLETKNEIDCKKSAKRTFRWEFYNESHDLLPEKGKFGTSPGLFKLNVPARSLDYGNYTVKMTINMTGIPDVSTTETAFIEIVASPLEAKIIGGTERAIGFNKTLVLNASMSSDPDMPDKEGYTVNDDSDIRLYWFCKKDGDNYTLPKYVDHDNLPPVPIPPVHDSHSNSSNDTGNDFGGCFKNGPGRLNSSSSVYQIDTSGLQESKTYTIRLMVTKLRRGTVFSDQKVKILAGDPPTVQISCKSNCGKKMNPSSKLSLEGTCGKEDCFYKWNISESERQLDDETVKNYTSTPIDSRYLVFMPPEPKGEVKYSLTLSANREGGAEGYSTLEVEVNSPPSGGSFDVTPKFGYALQKVFTLTAQKWIDLDVPLVYEMFCSISSNPRRFQLLFSGTKSLYTNESLPMGVKANNYTVHVRLRVSDSHNAFSEREVSIQVKVAEVDLKKLSDQSQSEVEDLMKNGNVKGAAAVMQVVAGVLNNEVATQKEDDSNGNGDNGKEPDEADKKKQEKEEQEKREQRIEMRAEFLKKVGEVEISNETDLSAIEMLASTVSEVSKVPEEISIKAQRQAATVLDSMTKAIIHKATSPNVGSEEITQIAAKVLTGLNNIMDAATVTIKETEVSATGKVSTTGKVLTTKEAKTAGEESKNVTLAATKMINDIVTALMKGMMPGQEATNVSTGNMDISFSKKTAENIRNSTVEASGARFWLPKYIGNIRENDVVNVRVMKRDKNVFVWGDSADRVGNSAICSLSLANEDGVVYPVRNLSKPIVIHVPQTKVTEGKKKRGRLTGSTLLNFKVNVTRDDISIILQIEQNSSAVEIELFVKKGAKPTVEDHDSNATLSAPSGSLYKHMLKTSILRFNGTATVTYFIGLRYKVPVKQTSDNQTIPTSPMNITISFFGASCLFWNPKTNTWESNGCLVSVKSTPLVTVCLCFHLTSFGSSFFVPPNEINVENLTTENFLKSPLLFIVVTSICGLYLLLLIPARRADKNDVAKTGVSPLPDNDTRDTYCYEIHVHTGFMRGAGTSAEVSVVLTGALDDSPPRVLKGDSRKNFRTGSVCPFLMTVPQSLGNLKQIRVWHNNAGAYPSWNLLRIMVQDIQTDQKWWFVNDDWLAVDEGDGKVDIMLPPATNEELTKFNVLFTSEVRKNLIDGHIWFSVVTRPARSTFTRVQRLTCCLSILLSTMLANAMWYKTGSEETPKNSISIGSMHFSIKQVSIGIMSSLVVFPANLIIVTLFRKSKPKPKPVAVYEETAVEVSEVVIDTGDETPAKKAAPKGLPHWCIYIAYVLAFGTSVASGVVVILYGIQFGPVKSEQWIISLSVSFIQDVMLSQPIKVFIMATLFALLIKDPNKAEDTAYGDKEALGNDEEWLKGAKDLDNEDKQLLMKIVNDKPPDEAKLEIARQLRMKERQMKAIIQEISWYMVFLLILLTISYGNRDLKTSKVTLNIRDLFVKASSNGTPNYNGIHSQKHWWRWLNNTVVPSLYPDTWYNDEDPYPSRFLADTPTDWLLGVTRLRQLRIQKNSCPFLPVFYHLISECNDFYSMDKEEKGEYLPYWKPQPIVNTTITPTVHPEKTPWEYQTGAQLKTFPYWGYKATYDAGGYVQILKDDVNKSQELLRDLASQNWVDRYTRAMFIEFSIYNPNTNLFSVVNLLFEQLPTGGLFPYPSILTLRLFRYTGGEMFFVLGCEIVYLLFSAYFVFREIKSFIKIGREHLKNPWSILEMFVTMLSLAAVVLYFMRLKFTNDAVRDLKTEESNFVSYHYCAFLDEWFNCVMGIIVFLSFLKLLRLLRFNRRMSMLQQTIKHASKELASFMIIYALAFFAFAQFACLVFGQSMEKFGTFMRSCASLMDTILGKFTLKDMIDANRIIGPIFFYSYTVSMVFVLINMFLSIINDSFNKVRSDVDKQANDYEIVDFMVHRLKENIGKTIGHAIRPLYKEPKSKLERDFDTIEEHADNVMHFMRNVTFEDMRKTKWFSADACNDKKKLLMRLLLEVEWDFYENEIADAIPAFEQFLTKYSNEEIQAFLSAYRRKRFIEELVFQEKQTHSDDDEKSSNDSDDSDNDSDDDSKDSDDSGGNDDDQSRTLADGEAADPEDIENEVRRVFGGMVVQCKDSDARANPAAAPSPGEDRPPTEQELLQVLEDVGRDHSSRCATDAEMDDIMSGVAGGSDLGPKCDSEPDSHRPKKKKGAKLWKKKAKEATAFVAPSKEAWGDAAGSSPEHKETEASKRKEKKRRKQKKAAEDGVDKDEESLDVEQSAEKTDNGDKEKRKKKKKKGDDIESANTPSEKATKKKTKGKVNEAFVGEQEAEGDDEGEKAATKKKKKKKKAPKDGAEMLIVETPDEGEGIPCVAADAVSLEGTGKKTAKGKKKKKVPEVQEAAEEELCGEQVQQKPKKKKGKKQNDDAANVPPESSEC